jgi:hypothetical protein
LVACAALCVANALTSEIASFKVLVGVKGLTMKKTNKTLLVALAITFASSGAWANSLTFQGVTFSTTDLGGGELQLTMTNALNASGNWQGIKYMESFAVGNVGSFTSASLNGFAYDAGGLSNGSASGCNGHGAGFACFTAGASPLALTNDMVFDISFKGGAANFSLPTLKVDFWTDLSQGKSTGDLLSQSVSATPLPAALPLYATGIGALALLRWRRKRKAAGLAAA